MVIRRTFRGRPNPLPARIHYRTSGKQSPSLMEDRRRFYEEYNAALDQLRSDPVAWATLLELDRELDGYLPEEDNGGG